MKTDKGRSGKRWYGMIAAGGLLMAGLLAGCPSRREERSSVLPHTGSTCENGFAPRLFANIVVDCVGGYPRFVKSAHSCVYQERSVIITSLCKQPVTVRWSDEKGELFLDYKESSFTLLPETPFRHQVGTKAGHYALCLNVTKCPPPPPDGGADTIQYPKAGTLDVFTSTGTEPPPEKQ
ncbi:hypothetical protein D7Y27_13610 [Corallococcus sp. AB004]|nr:hypothetical protein D7Y27_13610 [Corallococcus sp. AB004]